MTEERKTEIAALMTFSGTLVVGVGIGMLLGWPGVIILVGLILAWLGWRNL